MVKQELGGVCGTDIHMYHGHLPGIGYPIVLGHEFVGIVEGLGEGVTKDFLGHPLKVGDRIMVAPGVGCGKCYFCTIAKTPTCCESGFAYGFFADEVAPFGGGFAEYIYLHHTRTAVLKTDLPAEVAVIAEPMSVAIHAASRAGIRLGDTVVVQGSGAVGLTVQACAKLAGAAKIIHIGGPTDFRIQMAKEFGADITVNIAEVKDAQERIKMIKEETIKGLGADVVFECSGVPKAIPEGLDMLRTSGTFVEVGHFTDVGEVSINPFVQLCNKNINLQGSWGGEIEGFVRALPIMEKRVFPLEKLVTHTVGMERLQEIIKVPERGYMFDGKEALKICIRA